MAFGMLYFVGHFYQGMSPSAPPSAPPAAAVAALAQLGISVPNLADASQYQGSPPAYTGAAQVPPPAYTGAVQVPVVVASGAPPASTEGVPPPVVVMGKVVGQGEGSHNDVSV